MTNRNRSIAAVCVWVLLALPLNLAGQLSDFQTWYEAEIHKGIGRSVDLSVELEQRLKNNSLQYDRTLFTLSGEYDLNNYFETTGGARALFAADNESNVRLKYRLHLDAMGKYGIPPLELSLRGRLQYGFDEIGYIRDLDANRLVNRYRLRLKYDLFGSRFEFMASAERWYLLNEPERRAFIRMRYSGGVEYLLNFRSDLNLRYILEQEVNQSDPLTVHIVVIGYSYDL